ncbi:MAG: methyltransferase [Planctomycetes bacterium]|nr:methyltransferase [Planctomycetota bacterium]
MVTAQSPSAERLWFLRKFLREPTHIAALSPSSRWLAAAMVRDLAIRPGGAILEFGPGTGPFTAAIAEHLRAVPGSRYLGIERDPEFAVFLRRRFPQLEFRNDDVVRLGAILAGMPDLHPAAVVCGLPLVSMPVPVVDELLRRVAAVLPPGGVFRTFSYVHTMLNPSSWALRRRMRRIFRSFCVRGPVFRNAPPALIFEGAM